MGYYNEKSSCGANDSDEIPEMSKIHYKNASQIWMYHSAAISVRMGWIWISPGASNGKF